MEKWGQFEEWDKDMKSLSEMLGAKQYTIDFRASVLFGVPVISLVCLELEFENGKKYGQSHRTFNEAINGLRDFVRFDKNKQIGVCNTINKE